MKKIPVSWLKKKGVDPAPSDEIISIYGNYVVEDNKSIRYPDQLNTTGAIFNDKQIDECEVCITSFADRPNTGKQLVADWVPVVISNDYLGKGQLGVAGSFRWDISDSKYAIHNWHPDFDAIYDIYIKKKETTMQQKLVQDPDQYLLRECQKESLGAVADKVCNSALKPKCYAQSNNKPVFPFEGAMVVIDNKFYDCWNDANHLVGIEVKVMGCFDGLAVENGEPIKMVAVSDERGSSCCFRADMCKPIDTRTDEEKAIDDHWNKIENANKVMTLEDRVKLAFRAGAEWAGKLV